MVKKFFFLAAFFLLTLQSYLIIRRMNEPIKPIVVPHKNMIEKDAVITIKTESNAESATSGLENYKAIQKPCLGNMLWKERKQNKQYPRTDFDNTQVFLTSDDLRGSVTINILTYANGERKHVGGDFWWMEIHGNNSMYSYIRDNADGTYEARFQLPEPGRYEIDLTLEFSQCDGLRDPPEWWFRNGDGRGKHQKAKLDKLDDFIGRKKKFYVKKESLEPLKIRTRVNMNDLACTYINPRHGYWKLSGGKEEYIAKMKPIKQRNVTENRNTLWVYGDSVGMRFFKYLKTNHSICRYFNHCENTYAWIYPIFPDLIKNGHKDFNETITLTRFESILTNIKMASNRSILLINFGLHVMMDLSFHEASQLFLNFIKLKNKLKKTQEMPKIIWKTTTPVLDKKKYMDANRFLTKQRIILWNAFTKEVACKEGIPILDVYELAASNPAESFDGVHFNIGFFEHAALAFEFYLNREH
ncbi:uncharacterized protein LOC130636872 [Hydractinia symbiolongicarpus]|uniref:uncharacterized protein LOC130636872 n=1 Tax=Hydractinia symbiolongicarpus TaxID=13093 RepID=UPI00254E988E|nr:uncharacterized protein LOC130636872 [Hydractinia symbiolongicarpus]